jgi:hypothetical protein
LIAFPTSGRIFASAIDRVDGVDEPALSLPSLSPHEAIITDVINAKKIFFKLDVIIEFLHKLNSF